MKNSKGEFDIESISRDLSKLQKRKIPILTLLVRTSSVKVLEILPKTGKSDVDSNLTSEHEESRIIERRSTLCTRHWTRILYDLSDRIFTSRLI